ncbi:hypothetical protein PDESU_05504 [Pontiella desulfatans]|uniref:PD-(D/E)XK endonuclease-like domain-containing protein n=1 Tax=Pontiella desulfatans TaxID=2750659 RepID=A0A6C2U9Y1_PONDE|nr:PD-(D/E)XK nuclease family protein [Pontiella desulfatans]VGO16912.1 hypothetical protein PDESU_05504 [Pontiella desulfatans]
MKLEELRKRPHWSYSSLQSLLFICSLAWKFQKVDKLKPSHTPVSLAYGSCYHRVLTTMYNGIMKGSPLSVDDVAELFTSDWRSTVGKENVRYGKLDADGIEEQGRKLVRLAYDHVDPDEEVISISEVFAVPVRYNGRFMSKPLVGEFDLVIRGKDGAPVVVDWKTSATRWAKNRAGKSLQATAYSYAYSMKHGENVGVRFDVAVKNVRPVFEQHSTMRGTGDWNLLSKLVAKADAIVEHGLHYANLDSFGCSGCPYAGACAEWCRSAEEPAVMAA